jgi:hypothetical protein
MGGELSEIAYAASRRRQVTAEFKSLGARSETMMRQVGMTAGPTTHFWQNIAEYGQAAAENPYTLNFNIELQAMDNY